MKQIFCHKCVNTIKNPTIKFNKYGICHICESQTKDIHLPNFNLIGKHLFWVLINQQKIFIILVNGNKDNVMVLANYIFQIKVHTMDSLKMEELKEMVDYIIQTVIFILVSGKMIKPMDKANMLLEMELCIKALGLKTKEAGMGANNGQMVLFLMDYIKIIKRMELAILNGLMVINIMGILKIIKKMDREQ